MGSITVNRVLQGDAKNRGVRRRLRSKLTPAENRLWWRLRARQFHALKFRRQHGIGPYIVDFYCSEKAVVLEVDGDVHRVADRMVHDQEREKALRSLGLRIIRYTNDDIMNNLAGVLADLSQQLLLDSTSPHPSLQRRGTETSKD